MQYSSSHPDIMAKLLESFYVDDLVCGGNDDDEAYKHYSFARDALRHVSFNLRKFITSSHTLRDRMKREVDPCSPKDISVGASDVTCVHAALSTELLNQPEEHKVLGVRRNIESDQLIFEPSTIAEATITLVPTKRRAISLIGRFYDPLGFLSPITIRFKVLVHELCQS